ncbi:hypothetical protein CAC42_2009 [Sphaceloma murrayae]|uniref:Uncharacterized protein n=1 Tax=Sphaceloma murrayae TaxID=2082308 RepID=A0A2K1QIQ8_9PEZI|nr:hypothetical protein CAC42_2009 [Sphaceloma murrayae]
MYFGPTGMAVDPVILPAPASKHTHPASKRRSDPFSDHSSEQASLWSGSGDPFIDELQAKRRLTTISADDEDLVRDMNTSTSLLVLPAKNPSYQLAYFLKTTGPPLPPPEKAKRHQRTTSMPKGFWRFKTKDKRSAEALPRSKSEGQKLRGINELPELDERLPASVEARVSKSGKKYYQIASAESSEAAEDSEFVPTIGSDIIDSRVSISFSEALDEWSNLVPELQTERVDEQPEHRDRTASGSTIRIITQHDDVPVRPPASSPPSPTCDCEHDLHGEKTGERPSVRFERVDTTTPLQSNPRSPCSASSEPISAVPPVPPVSPTMAKSLSTRQKRLSTDTLGRVANQTGKPPNALRQVAFPKAHRRNNSQKSVSPGPPPPKSPLRINRAAGSIDWNLTGNPTQPSSPDKASPVPSSTGTFKSVGYHELPTSKSQSSTGSSGSSEPAIATGRQWIVQSKTKANDVPVIDVHVAAPSPRPRRTLRRARAGSSKMTNNSINKRMSLHQTSQSATITASSTSVRSETEQNAFHFPSNPIIRPLPSSGPPFNPKHRKPRPLSIASTSSSKRRDISIPVRHSSHPRPRNARMLPHPLSRRHSRLPTTPPPSSPLTSLEAKGQDIQTISPMTINAGLPSPPPKRSLPPTPDEKRLAAKTGGARTKDTYGDSGRSHETTDDSPRRRIPRPLTIDRVVDEFPSPPSSARSGATQGGGDGGGGESPLNPGGGRGSAHHIVRHLSSRGVPPPTSKFSLARGGRGVSALSGSAPLVVGDGANQAVLVAMQARLDAVERHSRLVEAALMAVLKKDAQAGAGAGAGPGCVGCDHAARGVSAGCGSASVSASVSGAASASVSGAGTGAGKGVAVVPGSTDVADGRSSAIASSDKEVVDRLLGSDGTARRASDAASVGSQKSALDAYMRARGMMDTSGISFD